MEAPITQLSNEAIDPGMGLVHVLRCVGGYPGAGYCSIWPQISV